MVSIIDSSESLDSHSRTKYTSTVGGHNATSFREALEESAIAFVFAHCYHGYSLNLGYSWDSDLVRALKYPLSPGEDVPEDDHDNRIYYVENLPSLKTLRFLLIAGCCSMGCHHFEPEHLLGDELSDKDVDCVAGFHTNVFRTTAWQFSDLFFAYAHGDVYPGVFEFTVSQAAVSALSEMGYSGTFDCTSDISLRPAKWGE